MFHIQKNTQCFPHDITVVCNVNSNVMINSGEKINIRCVYVTLSSAPVLVCTNTLDLIQFEHFKAIQRIETNLRLT